MYGALAVLCVLVTSARWAAAGLMPDPEPEGEAKQIEFEALPYGWVPGMYGSVDVKGRTAQIDVSPIDLLRLVTSGNAMAAAGYFSLSYGHFSVFADTFGGYGELPINERIPTQFCTLTVQGRDKTKFVIGDVGFGYQLGRWSLPARKRPLTLGVYVGARYMYFTNQLNATGAVVGGVQRSANSFETFAWADPLIGVRFAVPLADWLSLDFRGDIGGFGASSNLIWGISSMAKVWLPWTPFSLHPYLALGYRVVDFDRSNSAGSINLDMRGPTVGAGFVF
jgi:hypothetical protein